ncbi:hypothetical protein H2199_004509 [Coniosporium tulheliwenetii]|uniref:Uncharacterized protein n=1 Tax=Coniosporium tulheliwenetii TaxID=3383036 RepID=A0ACC2Z5P1_9PEZI|nr:hypothetical protein H2199_004509 [Cladosporium sp. JES 115]
MSSTHTPRRSINNNQESKQLYHNSTKPSGDVDVQVTSHDPDQEDMPRMGKKSDLKRIFRQSSMIAFTCIVQATWQVLVKSKCTTTTKTMLRFRSANTQGLLNGGHAGIFWSYQATAAGATFVVRTLIQGVLVAYRPSFTPAGWQGTLFVIAVTVIVGIINVVFAGQLPQIQKFMAVLFGLGWIPIVGVLIALAPHPDASVVFTQLSSTGGWMPLGLSVMVGQISSVYCLISFDAAAHMSEEVKRASLSVPRAMMWSYTASACVGLLVVFAYLYSISSIEDALGSPTGFPFLYVFQQATYNGTIPLVTMILIIATAGCTGFILTCVTTMLLSLINIGSTVAFNAIISLQLIALMSTYSISIGCVLYQRTWGGNNLPPAQWSLGSAGKYINGVAFVYTVYLLF